jgi:hypothetical protein
VTEEWRSIDDFYCVSSEGRVRRTWSCSGNFTGRILKSSRGTDGYGIVTLSAGNIKKTRLVHALVCLAFHGPKPFPGAEVRHLNGDPADSRAANLCWGTHAENMQDRVTHGTAPLGDKSARATLSNDEVRAARSAYRRARAGRWRAPDGLIASLADSYGVNVGTFKHILRGKGYREAA